MRKIPQAMQETKQWLYWKHVGVNGDKKKMPHSQIGRWAKWRKNPEQYKSFEDVMDWRRKGFDGIDFVLTENDPFTIIDLDDCVENGLISNYAEKVIKYFDSYTETSYSGTGLHIVVEGKCKNIHRVEIEIYSYGKCISMTGDAMLDRPVANRQQELNKVMLKFKPTPKPHRTVEPNGVFNMPRESFGEGQRNNQLAVWAGILRKKNLSESQYFAYLKKINQECCVPPVSDFEVNAIGKSIWSY